MGNPLSLNFTSVLFSGYRVKRIELGISPATLNRELQTFKAVFSDLIRLGIWRYEHPLKFLCPVKCHQPKTTYLTKEQIQNLLFLLKGSESDAYLIALVCLSTGARWGEAQKLTVSDISGMVHFHDTKSKKSRSVPLSRILYDKLYLVLSVRNFTNSYSTFTRRLMDSGINLPKGQRTHVLRHTFASHFMMNGGNILSLQKILAHSTLDMTLKYSHLAPDFLKEVLDKNPIALTVC